MFKSLLLAVDINDPKGAFRASQVAVDMAMQNSARLHVVNVVPDAGLAIVSASLGADHNKAAMAQAKEELATWASTTLPENLANDLHVARGTIYDQIIKTARNLGVDDIIVGAHSPGFQDYLIGSNAARVARHATQSVFVIR